MSRRCALSRRRLKSSFTDALRSRLGENSEGLEAYRLVEREKSHVIASQNFCLKHLHWEGGRHVQLCSASGQEAQMSAIRFLAFFASSLAASAAVAQAPLPSFPLYCQGPLMTTSHSSPPPPPSVPTLTKFKWANVGAGAQPPAPGECAWADRGVRPEEIVNSVEAHGNAICDNSGIVNGLAAGKYLEVGVYRDPAKNNCIATFVRQNIAAFTPAQIQALQEGIRVMVSWASNDPTSYSFQANIHGTYEAQPRRRRNPDTAAQDRSSGCTMQISTGCGNAGLIRAVDVKIRAMRPG